MKYIIFLLTIIFIIGCGQVDKNISDTKESSSDKKKIWFDTLLVKYINKTDNELIKNARENNISEEWLLDSVENTDSAKYFIFHIGHDIVDSGNVNPRFVTDGWVYVDSLKKIIYEYDLQNEL